MRSYSQVHPTVSLADLTCEVSVQRVILAKVPD